MIRSAALFILLLTATAPGAEIVLSPDGEIKTLNEARDAARKAEKPAKIIVQQGTYTLTEPLALGPEDSETTWQAAPGASPVFSGGKKISGWTKLENGLWKADLPEVKEGKWYFQQLWINGRRATRARTPNKGFLNMLSQASTVIFPDKEGKDPNWEQTLRYQGFITSKDTVDKLLQAKPEELPDVTVIIPHTWDVHHYHVKEINKTASAVLLHGPKIRELLTYEPDGRFYVENYKAALDAPGEWYLSRNGELFYQPLPNEDMSKAEVVAPVAEMLLKIEGSKDLTFRGISFKHQQWLMGPDGFGVSQAAQTIGAAIEIDHARRVNFEQCEIAHTGGYAIWYRFNSRWGVVQHSHIHDLGAGGVRMGPTSQKDNSEWKEPKVDTGYITVHNCIIQHGGRIFPDAIGVFIGHSGDNVISHNDIADFYYSAISAGWHWGYGESVAQRNRIENNHIHYLGWGFTSDMGGFYNLGPSFGTVVRGNYIHHVASYRYGGWGLYTDEGSSGVLMENNLVHDTSESSFHQHYGFYNTIRNNIFAFGGKAQIQRSRPESRTSFILERNIVVWDPDKSKFLDGSKYNWEYTKKEDRPRGDPAASYIIRKNLYWPINGKMPLIAENWTWEEWQKEGRDAGSLVADPLFESIEKRDFRLKKDSPAAKIGFEPWDLKLAGVRADGPRGAAWQELAKATINYPNWDEESKPWPSPEFSMGMEGFEYRSLTTPNLPRQQLQVENKGDAIVVTDEVASPIPVLGVASDFPSKRSLKLQDAEGLDQEYNPHYILQPKYETGTVYWSFDIMARDKAPWYAEMRSKQDVDGYKVGPSVSWRDGKFYMGRGNGTFVMDLPAGQWARVEVSAPLGSFTWNLEITRQDGSKFIRNGLKTDKDWLSAMSVMWCSLATTKTEMFIDNIHISRKQ